METFFNLSLMWFLLGLVMILLELLIPGLIIIFFGFGAILTGTLSFMFDISLNYQIIIFLTSSILSLLLLRKYINNKFFNQKRNGNHSLDDEFINKQAIAIVDFEPNGIGKVEFKGTNWNATSSDKIKKGELVKITGKDSINLKVELQ
jgi:membrane protein implicated in regulation of membrane protease activity